MKQLLEKKQGTRAIVFALLLTMMAWLVPANVGIAKAATIENGSAVKVGKPLYKQCANRIYVSKYKPGVVEGVTIKFGKASKGKIKLYIGCFPWESGGFSGTRSITGTVQGKNIKFKTKKWYSADESGGLYRWSNKVSGTITLVNKNTIKLKIKSGEAGDGPLLKPGKKITLRYDANAKDIFQYLY